MTNDLFDDLMRSVQQMDDIARGCQQPSRTFRLDADTLRHELIPQTSADGCLRT